MAVGVDPGNYHVDRVAPDVDGGHLHATGGPGREREDLDTITRLLYVAPPRDEILARSIGCALRRHYVPMTAPLRAARTAGMRIPRTR